jgi:beta-xylosidase
MPRSFQQMAGLACFYDTNNWVYLRVSRHEDIGRALAILICDNGSYDEPLHREVAIPKSGPVFLRVDFERELFCFSFSIDDRIWTQIGPHFQSAKLSGLPAGENDAYPLESQGTDRAVMRFSLLTLTLVKLISPGENRVLC